MRDYIRGEYIYGDDVCISDDYLDERWWYIDGAPGYMISDRGRVWSEKNRIFLRVKQMDRHGHLGVSLCIDSERRYEYIHRLMARAFIPNPDGLPVVRHMNDIPYDNDLANLCWGTQKDNIRDAIVNGRAHFPTPEERELGLSRMRKPIRAINNRTGEEFLFSGQSEASRVLGIHQANIWKVLNGERAHAMGYFFEYLEGGDTFD